MTVETKEIALQTWQAYRSSKYIGRFTVSQLYGFMICINCWSTSLIHYVWEHRFHQPLMARFLSVLTDIVLDFIWGVVLQVMLFWRYWMVYLDQSRIGDMLQIPETPDRELRQILVLSDSNFLLSVFPFVTSVMVMREICNLLKSTSISSKRAKIAPEARALEYRVPSSEAEPSMATKVPTLDDASRRSRSSTFKFAYMITMCSYGVITLAVSITASRVLWHSDASRTQCIDPLYPWFTTDVACVGRVVNCSALGLHGSKTELTPVLESFSSYLLGNLAITDCRGLEVPSTLLVFEGVQTIAIRRSTLTEWTTEAAITATSFPELQSVQLIDSSVECRPAGIMEHRFPANFEWLRVKSTDVQAFIHDVGDAWFPTRYFHCIDCGLTTPPHALEHMQGLTDLQLPENALTTLSPSFVHGKPDLWYLTLAGNPISRLEAEVWALVSQLFLLDIQDTNISTIPGDATSKINPNWKIWASSTPMCATTRDKALLPHQVTCENRSKSS